MEPLRWDATVERISDTEYDFIAKATLNNGWHLYAQDLEPVGPIATAFAYEAHDAVKIIRLLATHWKAKGTPLWMQSLKWRSNILSIQRNLGSASKC